MIPKETIDLIFETARIEEVVGEFVNLKKAGANYKGLSPFVNEKTPSFVVSPTKQIFKDFSSGKGGNVVTFLMETEQFSYPEALKYLAKKYGIEIQEKEQTPEQKEKSTERESLFILNQFAADFFEEQLHNSEEGINIGLSYFKERGFSSETIKKFNLGFSPKKKDAFSEAAKSKGYDDKYISLSGLGINKESYWVDRFRERVIFPIHSLSGRVLGFGGRILRSDVKAAKYLNSPESPIYHKSKILYGLFQAKKEIIKQDRCYLVEGYTDVISLHQAGIENVVASSGTALTTEQIALIQRLTPNITILYDGDPAGIKASFRGIDMVLEAGMNVKVLLFPDGEDPDSFVRNNSSEALVNFLENSQLDFIQFKAQLLKGGTQNDPIKRAGVIKDIVSSIGLIPDPITRDIYLKECATIMDIEERVLSSELAIVRNKNKQNQAQKREQTPRMEVVPNPAQAETNPKKDFLPKHFDQESALIYLLLNHGHKEIEIPNEPQEANEEEDEEAVTKLSIAYFITLDLLQDPDFTFNHQGLKNIFQAYADAYNAEEDFPTGISFTRSEDTEISQLATDLLTEKYQLSDWTKKEIYVSDPDLRLYKYASEAIYRFKEVKVSDHIQQIESQISSGVEGQERVDLYEHLKTLLELKGQINKILGRVI